MEVSETLEYAMKHDLPKMMGRLLEELAKRQTEPCILSTIFPAGAKPDFALGDEKDYVAYTIPNCRRLPDHHINDHLLVRSELESGSDFGEMEADACHIVDLGPTRD